MSVPVEYGGARLWIKEFDSPYRPYEGFTLSFYINPRYNDPYDYVSEKAKEFRAGTIMHMSSCYAISLVTGSSLGQDKKPDQFRIMLQLSHSADVSPSEVDLTVEGNKNVANGKYGNQARAYPEDLIFLTSDSGSLKYNHWHHVAITWGGPAINECSGSIYIDNKLDTQFVLHNSESAFTRFFPPYGPSIANPAGLEPQLTGRDGTRDPDALIVGNYYEGRNRIDDKSAITLFFNKEVEAWEGIDRSAESVSIASPLQSSLPDSTKFELKHPLNAEIHDLRIYKTALDTDQIYTASQVGPRFVVTQSSFKEWLNSTPAPGVVGKHVVIEGGENVGFGGGKASNPDLMLYLPPFFVKESRTRLIHKGPWQRMVQSSSTVNPINARLSFHANIHDINLENFTREFVRGEYPRLYHLTASAPGDGSSFSNTKPHSINIRNFQYVECNGSGLALPGDATWPVRDATVYGGSSDDRRSVNKRELTILPNDNGLFQPNFSLLLTGTTGGRQLTAASSYTSRRSEGVKLRPPLSENDPEVYDRNFSLEIVSGSELDKSVNRNSSYFKDQPVKWYHLSLAVAATAKLVISSKDSDISPAAVNGKKLRMTDASTNSHTMEFDTSIISDNSTSTKIGYGQASGGDITDASTLRLGIINAINRTPAATLGVVASIGEGGNTINLVMTTPSVVGNGSRIQVLGPGGAVLGPSLPSSTDARAMFSFVGQYAGGLGGPQTGFATKPVPRPQGVLDLSIINMSDILFVHPDKLTKYLGSLKKHMFLKNGIYANHITPFQPAQTDNLGNDMDDATASYMYQQLRSPGSNAKVLFDIPHLFYGDRIDPGSMTVFGGLGTTKLSLTEEFQDTLKITLKDNGQGLLYRADAKTTHAKWNKVGNAMYDEGLLLITSPHLKDFGEFFYQVDLRGTHNVHVLEIMIPCPAGRINSSSNPGYQPLESSDMAYDKGSDFVYITGLSLHDDNFNVISRTNLAQPVIKREGDKLMFKVKIDH